MTPRAVWYLLIVQSSAMTNKRKGFINRYDTFCPTIHPTKKDQNQMPLNDSWCVLILLRLSRWWVVSSCSIDGPPRCFFKTEGGTWAASVGSRCPDIVPDLVATRLAAVRTTRGIEL